MTNQEVKEKMNELKNFFPNGKFWNHNVSDPNNPWSVTDYPCDHINNGYYGCNAFENDIQDSAFAIFMAFLIFGSYPIFEDEDENYEMASKCRCCCIRWWNWNL